MQSAHSAKIELLAPAGNPEKLEIAVHYGADAVYLAGKAFSLRSFAGNFTLPQLQAGVALAHGRGVKVYVAVNVFPRNDEMEGIADFLAALNEIGPDGIIVADPAVFMAARRSAPAVPVHVSTQANTTNHQAARFWQELGARRIIAARELSLREIREIIGRTGMEVEAFVHGAMCISYSGRCLLSNFMAGRGSNQGMCCHPCRWRYAVVEETRPGQYFPLVEDERGTYIFNSRDLCMIDHVPALIEAGITSLKIEGRMKGIHYLASVVKVYREAIDACYEGGASDRSREAWHRELGRLSNRGYSTGFYFGDPREVIPAFETHAVPQGPRFIGKVIAAAGPGKVKVAVRNRFFRGEAVEVLTPHGPVRRDRIGEIRNLEGEPLEEAPNGTEAIVALATPCAANDLLRQSMGD